MGEYIKHCFSFHLQTLTIRLQLPSKKYTLVGSTVDPTRKDENFIQCTHKRITELLDTNNNNSNNNNNNNTLYFYRGCHGILEVSNKLVALYLKLY